MQVYDEINNAIKNRKYVIIDTFPTKANNHHYIVIIEINKDDLTDSYSFDHYNGKSETIQEFISDTKREYKYLILRKIEYTKKRKKSYYITLEAYDYKDLK